MITLISGAKGLIGRAVCEHIEYPYIPYDLPEGIPDDKKYHAFIDCARYEHPCLRTEAWDAVIDALKRKSWGRMILFSSLYGHKAPDFDIYIGTEVSPTPLEYALQKGGIENATRFLAKKLLPYNIQVNCIAPGGVMNNHSYDFQSAYQKAYGVPMINVDSIMPVINMLLHPKNKVNGQVIAVDGGVL